MIMEFSHLCKVSLHEVTVRVTDSLKMDNKVCLEHRTFICVNRLKFLPDTVSGRLTFDLDESGAVNSSVDNLTECCLLLFIVVNLLFVSFQLVIGEQRLGSRFKKFSTSTFF